MLPIRIVFWRSLTDTRAQPVDISWADLVGLLTRHTPTDCHPCQGRKCHGKMNGAGWSAAIYRPGTTRGLDNVLAITAAVYDVDHATPDQLWALGERLNRANVAYIIHSSHNHAPPADCRIRLILPVTRPVLAAEWPRFHAAVVADLQIPSDSSVKDASRLFFLPTAPRGSPVIAAAREGSALDVDTFLRLSPASPIPSAPTVPALPTSGPVPVGVPGTGPAALPAGLGVQYDPGMTLEDLKDFLRRVTRQESRALARKILDGKPLADIGEQDTTLNRATSLLATTLPAGTPPDLIIAVLKPSLAATNWLDGYEHLVGQAYQKLDRALKRRQINDAVTADRNRRHFDALQKAGGTLDHNPHTGQAVPTGPYTVEEVQRWAQELGRAPEELYRELIIQKSGAYFVFVNGAYRSPIPEKDLPVSLPRDLSRTGIRFTRPNKEGLEVPVPPSEILRLHGTVARQLQASLVLQKSYYDPTTQTFWEAVCPARKITPREHPEIDKWLDLIGGREASKLKDWVATVLRLDRQSAAIYAEGKKGAGKGMLAAGLARLWTTAGPSELHSVLSGWNDTLTICPLVFADEALPTGPGKNPTADLRRIIGSTSRTLTRKFVPNAILHGALRVIIAANNDRLLDTGEDLSANDLEAVAGRFLHIQVGKEAADYLEHLGGPSYTRPWVEEDQIAEHALYLAQTRDVDDSGRFLVQGSPTELHEHLAVSSGNAGQVCEWLTNYLINSRAIDATPIANYIRVGSGELLVNVKVMADESRWGLFVASAKLPQTTALGRALRNLSRGTATLEINGETITYHRIKVDLVLTWAKRNQLGDMNRLLTRIRAFDPQVLQAVA